MVKNGLVLGMRMGLKTGWDFKKKKNLKIFPFLSQY